MVENSNPEKKQRNPDKKKKQNSSEELTFSCAYACLQEAVAKKQFLGFTLSPEYVPVHKLRSKELAMLQEYFPLEALQAVVVWSVHGQSQPVIKWTEREAMETYLKANGVT